jgi:queuine tRNA-ribosyltransferase
MIEMADVTLPILPDTKPKYIMGVGTPEDIVTLVSLGAKGVYAHIGLSLG